MKSKKTSSLICKWLPTRPFPPPSSITFNLVWSKLVLIDYRYDGDEPAPSTNHLTQSATTTAPVNPPASTQNDVPGYGEEPEVAYDPNSFDVDITTNEDPINGAQISNFDPEPFEKPAPVESSGITMKEDG